MGLTAFAFWLLYPTYYFYAQATPEEKTNNKVFCARMPGWAHCHHIVLGLDIDGGLHLVMRVKVAKALSDKVDHVVESIQKRLQDKKIDIAQIKHESYSAFEEKEYKPVVAISLKKEEDVPTLLKIMHDDFSVFDVGQKIDGLTYQFEVLTQEQKAIKEDAIEQAIITIRNRADKLGASEPVIAKRGEDHILIELPGEKDPEHAIEVIGKTAKLEFSILMHSNALDSFDLPEGVMREYENYADEQGATQKGAYLKSLSKEKILQAAKGHVPDGMAVKIGAFEDPQTGAETDYYRSYLVTQKPGITGDYLTNAAVQMNQQDNQYYVGFSFDKEGAEKFGELTGKNINKQLAIILDDFVKQAPRINSKIEDSGMITLGNSRRNQQAVLEEAKGLALVLKSGALAAPIEVGERRQVGAMLGAESIQKGQKALLIGLILVVLWMAIYYKGSGMIANFALIFNFVFLIAVLAGLDATLTLPGMAGIALTLGMAVDANVIILERIREEMRAGRTIKAAVETGYDKAFWTIVDAHVTALVAGVILWQYGSGPVRNFATTLIIGIAASLYTSIVITKMVYEYKMMRNNMETLSI